jgi:uncharacterized phage infection (PIP) family protein YhgE
MRKGHIIMNKKRGSLRYLIIAVILCAVIITGACIELFSAISTIQTNSQQTEAYAERLLDDVKAELNYTAYYEPFDWVMGTGVWIDDIDQMEAAYQEEAVDAMRSGAQSVIEGTETVNEAGQTFNNIVDMVYQISEESGRMSSIVEQLATGTDTIADNIRRIEDMSVSVADETSNVSASSQEQTASSQEVAEASDKLAENAQDLQGFVAKFNL